MSDPVIIAPGPAPSTGKYDEKGRPLYDDGKGGLTSDPKKAASSNLTKNVKTPLSGVADSVSNALSGLSLPDWLAPFSFIMSPGAWKRIGVVALGAWFIWIAIILLTSQSAVGKTVVSVAKGIV